MEQNYERLYLKYKAKYLELKNSSGGMFPIQTRISQSEAKKARRAARRAKQKEKDEAAAAAISQIDSDRAESQRSEAEFIRLREKAEERRLQEKARAENLADEIIKNEVYKNINPKLERFDWFPRDMMDVQDLLYKLSVKIKRVEFNYKNLLPLDTERPVFKAIIDKLTARRERLRRLSGLFFVMRNEKVKEEVPEFLADKIPRQFERQFADAFDSELPARIRHGRIQAPDIREPVRGTESYMTPNQRKKKRQRAREERREDRFYQ